MKEELKKASNFRKEKHYLQAIEIYQNLYNQNGVIFEKFDLWSFAFCLKNALNYTKALDICRTCYKKFPDFELNKSLYAQCIYKTEIDTNKIIDEKIFEKAANAIIKLCKQDDKYAPYKRTVFAVLSYHTKKSIYKPENILFWLEKLSLEQLSKDCFSIVKDGKNIEFASDFEQYYMFAVKANYMSGNFEKCKELCVSASKEISKFHYSNDIWFARSFALCLYKTGEPEKAVSKLIEISHKKKEFFIFHEIAEIYFELQNIEKAEYFAIIAIKTGENFEKKLKLLTLLAKIFQKKEKVEISVKHSEFRDFIKKQYFDTSQEVKNDIENIKKRVRELKKELSAVWNTVSEAQKIKLSGKIIKLLENSKAGFIKTDKEKSYYFSIKDVKGNKELKEGSLVSFVLAQGFDKKKQKETEIAVEIKIL